MIATRRKIYTDKILDNLLDAQKNMASAEKVDAKGLVYLSRFILRLLKQLDDEVIELCAEAEDEHNRLVRELGDYPVISGHNHCNASTVTFVRRSTTMDNNKKPGEPLKPERRGMDDEIQKLKRSSLILSVTCFVQSLLLLRIVWQISDIYSTLEILLGNFESVYGSILSLRSDIILILETVKNLLP